MMRSNWKKFAALGILSAMLMGTLAGCGGSDSGGVFLKALLP